ncbi:hypothetical protein UlMin_035336 [Ulmus minor]
MDSSIFLYFPIFLVLYIFTNHLLHVIRNLPPTPLLCLPIIGHLYLLKRPVYRTLSKLSDRYGPVLFLWYGSRRVLVVSSPSAAEECLTKNDIVFANRPNLMLGKITGYNNTSVVWASYGDHWRNLRRISSLEILSTHRLQMLYSIRQDEVKSLIYKLLSKQNQIVDMKTPLVELTLNVMMRMIAGKRYYGDNVEDAAETRKFRENQREAHRLTGKQNLGDHVPILRWFGVYRSLEKGFTELHRKRDEFMQNLIEEHKRKMESDLGTSIRENNKTLIEVLLRLQQTEPEYYKDEIIRGLMMVLILAGTETSSNTMEWALGLLLNHSEVLKKAQAEIDKQVGNDRLIEESDLPKLPYLQGIINETLRMYPVVPLLVPHESSEGCTVSGYRVPAGTTLFVNAWAIQNDPKIWEDPRSFKPERFVGLGWLTKDGFKSIPFGSGRRGCPGEGLAMRVVGLTLGSLIQCFEWDRPCKEMMDMTEGAGATLPKAKELQAKCRPRSTMINVISQIRRQ